MRVLLLILSLVFIRCSKPDKFDSRVLCTSNRGYGVLITKITKHDTPNIPVNTIRDRIFIAPSYPGTYDYSQNDFLLRKHKEIPKVKLSNYITFDFQYIQLENCSSVDTIKTTKLIFLGDYINTFERGDTIEVNETEIDNYLSMKNEIQSTDNSYKKIINSSNSYCKKIGCKTWIPIDSLRFTKTIDLRPYQKSNKIKRFRKRNKHSSGSYFGTRIIYQFYDKGEVKLHLENYITNPWK